MEVILREDVANLGKMGEVVRVRDGYARNYLLPRKLVLIANKKNLKSFEHQKRVVADQRGRVVKQAETLAEKLAALSLVFPVKAGEEGKLFGSVTNIDIVDTLLGQGHEVERAMVRMPDGPLKQVGDHPIQIALHGDVVVTITVSVLGES